jgi:hypothetical protein
MFAAIGAGTGLAVVGTTALVLGARSFGARAEPAGRKAVLVVGGNGALGQAVVDAFGAAGWHTLSADVT